MTTRRTLLQTVAALSGGLPLTGLRAAQAEPDPWTQADRIAARIAQPHFPARDFPITDYGAIEGGSTKSTSAITKAIEVCAKAGGGRVLVPQGIWLTGAIHLKSHVNLHIARGATLRFSTDPTDYLPLVHTRWEGVECMNYSPLIYALEQENIAVTGEGTLDGQASETVWWNFKGRGAAGLVPGIPTQDRARKALFAMGEADTPVEQRIFGEGSYLRPNFFEPYRCKTVLIEGVTMRNAPFWNVHPVLCTGVTVRGLTIDANGPNTDGCDPESCTDVLIENCTFNTGDDCIAIKSGRNGDGRRVNKPSENFVIRKCTMLAGHGGVTIGSEISGGVRNLFVEDCKMDSPDLWNAIRLKNNAMRGGVLENFHFRRIVIGQVSHAVLTIDFNYDEGAQGSFRPIARGIHLSAIVSGKSEYGIDAQGLANSAIEDITLNTCEFRNVAKGNIIKYVKGISFTGVTINGEAAKAPV